MNLLGVERRFPDWCGNETSLTLVKVARAEMERQMEKGISTRGKTNWKNSKSE
jgi:hypothetical protein